MPRNARPLRTAHVGQNTTVGILGVGELAAALVEGLLSGPYAGPEILLSPRGAATAQRLAARHSGVRICSGNQAVTEGADVLFLTVPPSAVEEVCTSLRVRRTTIVVSAIAGVSHDRLRRLLAHGRNVSPGRGEGSGARSTAPLTSCA